VLCVYLSSINVDMYDRMDVWCLNCLCKCSDVFWTALSRYNYAEIRFCVILQTLGQVLLAGQMGWSAELCRIFICRIMQINKLSWANFQVKDFQTWTVVGWVILDGRIFKSETSRPRPVAGQVLLPGRAWGNSWASITR